MMRLLYRFSNAFHVDRLFIQHDLETIAAIPACCWLGCIARHNEKALAR